MPGRRALESAVAGRFDPRQSRGDVKGLNL